MELEVPVEWEVLLYGFGSISTDELVMMYCMQSRGCTPSLSEVWGRRHGNGFDVTGSTIPFPLGREAVADGFPHNTSELPRS